MYTTTPTTHPEPTLTDLRTERIYLLNTLRLENHRATNLLQKISTCEAKLREDSTPARRRKSRKQLGWMRYKLDEANKQEAHMLSRLGQLAWEITIREQWVEENCGMVGDGCGMFSSGRRVQPQSWMESRDQAYLQSQNAQWQPVQWQQEQQPGIEDSYFPGEWSLPSSGRGDHIPNQGIPFEPEYQNSVASLSSLSFAHQHKEYPLPSPPPPHPTPAPVINDKYLCPESPRTAHRVASLSALSLDVLATEKKDSSVGDIAVMAKRNSLPSLPGMDGCWSQSGGGDAGGGSGKRMSSTNGDDGYLGYYVKI